jgi:predicted porin
MKKSLLALAVLGVFAGAASAQSSVTIYGSLDLAVTKGKGGTATGPGSLTAAIGGNGDNGLSKAWIEKQSNSSRLGFRGNEDLGGGMSAQFQIEHRFTPDNGAANSTFWAGRSYVQLSSATAGRIYLGREYTPAFWPAVKSDPFGWDGVAQMGAMMWAGYLTPASAPPGGVRSSNTVGYKSPSWSGLTLQAAVGLGEAVTSRTNGFNAEYGAGPIYAALGYEKLAKGPVTTDGNSLINLAFHYDLGMVKPMLYFARAKVSNGVTGGALTNKYVSLGVLAPIGGGTLKAAYGRTTLDNAFLNNGNESKFGIGYDYPLSKRTNVYADAQQTRKGQGNSIAEFTNNNTFALGVKHTF